MSYVDTYPASSTGVTPMGKVTKTTYDGFGRPTRAWVLESGNQNMSNAVWSVTDTVYDACSCSTTGKSKKTSRPYRVDYQGNIIAGQTGAPFWTTSTFDALGRPVQVTLPDGHYTAYAYGVENDSVNGTAWLGAQTTITDPSGKQKRYLYDGFGQLLRVDEPNSSAVLIETARYTYDILGHMTQVAMRKADGSYTQTRTFVYNAKGQLTSATNPENGTVTYTYRDDGLLLTKTDAGKVGSERSTPFSLTVSLA